MRFRLTFASLLVGLLAVSAPRAMAGPVLLGGTSDGVIYDIDPLTGAVSNPRDTGVPFLRGLAFSPEGTLFGLGGEPRGFEFDGVLYQIEPDSGATSFVARFPAFYSDINWDFARSVIIGDWNEFLFSIDPDTGASGPVAPLPSNPMSVATNTRGELYGWYTSGDVDSLLRIDPSNGNILEEWVLDVNFGIGGMVFTSAETLLFVDYGTTLPGEGPWGTHALWMFDLSAGELTEIASVSPLQFTTLAYIPEPPVVWLLGLALGVWATFRVVRHAGILFACALAAGLLSTPGFGQVTETGLGGPDTLLFSGTFYGDFVVAGACTRSCEMTCPTGETLPCACGVEPLQSDPFYVEVEGIPEGAAIVKAFANWSYATDQFFHAFSLDQQRPHRGDVDCLTAGRRPSPDSPGMSGRAAACPGPHPRPEDSCVSHLSRRGRRAAPARRASRP